MNNKKCSTFQIALSKISQDVLVLMSTLEIVLANIPRAVLVLQDWWRSISETKWTFLLCAFFLTSFHSSYTVAFSSGVSIASGERSFLHVLTLREIDVSERTPDSSVPRPRFPNGRLNGRTSRVCNPFSLILHLRATRTLQALVLLEGFCPTGTHSARLSTMQLLSPFMGN